MRHIKANITLELNQFKNKTLFIQQPYFPVIILFASFYLFNTSTVVKLFYKYRVLYLRRNNICHS